MTEDETLAEVRVWAELLDDALQLEGAALDLDAVLGVAGVAARAVVRPAAPVTTYLVGYAVGRAAAGGTPVEAAFADAVATVRALAERRRGDGDGDGAHDGIPKGTE
ncbi:DUF6457 domain-containing protein [Lysinimonas soli]|uniref:DUF6457 domain-containing protein n=1 Tax=Lysinimonas soli TaxID=1074233 RepID=A0ABW0NPF2_9MICO